MKTNLELLEFEVRWVSPFFGEAQPAFPAVLIRIITDPGILMLGLHQSRNQSQQESGNPSTSLRASCSIV